MGNSHFFKLSLRLLVLGELDDIFNMNIIKDIIQPMCVWHGINWFDWVFGAMTVVVILISIYDFAKQIETAKAKITCTAIFICSVIITVASKTILAYFPEKVSSDTYLYLCIFALAMFFITLFEYKILPQKLGKKRI